MKFGLFARIAPFGVEQPVGQMEEQGRGPQVVGVNQIEIDTLADDSLVPRYRRTDQIRA